MYEILNISNWIAEGYSKGTREKYSVKDPNTEEKYLFKYPADYDGKKNGDIWAEKIATEVGKILNIKVQECYLAEKDGEQGILIKYSLDKRKLEYLEEGAIFFREMFTEFKVNKPPFYTFENIEICLKKEKVNIEEFIDIVFFDCIIGNTDRHCENWGILKKNGSDEVSLVSAYDNGSSLGREYHSNEQKIPNSIEEIKKYAKKALSCIRINDKERINLYDFLSSVLKKYVYRKKVYLEKIEFLTEYEIEDIINRIPDNFMSSKLKSFVIQLLLVRKEEIIKILKEEEKND